MLHFFKRDDNPRIVAQQSPLTTQQQAETGLKPLPYFVGIRLWEEQAATELKRLAFGGELVVIRTSSPIYTPNGNARWNVRIYARAPNKLPTTPGGIQYEDVTQLASEYCYPNRIPRDNIRVGWQEEHDLLILLKRLGVPVFGTD